MNKAILDWGLRNEHRIDVESSRLRPRRAQEALFVQLQIDCPGTGTVMVIGVVSGWSISG